MRHFFLCALVGVVSAIASGCIGLDALGLQREPLEETVVYGERGPKLLMLEIEGEITDDDRPGLLGSGVESTMARVREQLGRAERERVRGVLLRVNSPGGGATASEMIYSDLLRFKRETGVPIVAQFMSTAASGGYYIAMAADELQAYPTSVMGSIGVIAVGLNLSGLLGKIGVSNQTITAGAMKDAGSPLRPMEPGERAYLQAIVDEMHSRFREVVVAGRPKLGVERIEELADGRVYSAKQALEYGLIDRIAGIEAATRRLEELAGLEQSRVVSYHRPSEWRNNLFTRGPDLPTVRLELGALGDLLGRIPRSGFYYLWWPAFE